jgi:hypothetical protein
MTDDLDAEIANWANLTKDQQLALYKRDAARRSTGTDVKSMEAYRTIFEPCVKMFKDYLESLGPFEVVNGHNHALDVTDKYARETLIERLSTALTSWLLIKAPPVAQFVIDRHRAGTTIAACCEALRCRSCGVHSHVVEITGTKLRPLQYDMKTPRSCEHVEFEDCPIDATQPYSVEIDIPSGEMVVANFLTPLYGEVKDKYSEQNNINYVWGRKNCTEEYARRGYIEMNIGNCGCYLFKMNKAGSKFIMGDDGSVKGRKEVARVCTSFWGYGIADHEDAKLKGLAEKMKDHDFTIVKCVPGRYRFTHRYHLLRDGLSDDDIYTHIEKVG